MVGKGAQAFKNVPVKQKADGSKNEKYLQETTSVHVFYGSNCKLEKAIQGKGLFNKNQKKAPLLQERGWGEVNNDDNYHYRSDDRYDCHTDYRNDYACQNHACAFRVHDTLLRNLTWLLM
jgi:hypothetical protein